jgi:DNA-binding protein HU-beta
MNRSDIVAAISKNLEYPKAAVNEVLEDFIKLVTESLAQKEQVKITGIGTFYATERQARKARNPKTGESVDVPAKTVIKFKPSKLLKNLFK